VRRIGSLHEITASLGISGVSSDLKCIVAAIGRLETMMQNQEEMLAKMETNKEKMMAKLVAHHKRIIAKMEACVGKLETNPEKSDAITERQEFPEAEVAVETI
jgi:hypothetical protein